MQRITFQDLIRLVADRYDRQRLLYDTLTKRSLSYAESLPSVQGISKKLASAGLTKASIIVSYAPLSLEAVLLCWASWYDGLVFVPVDHNWPPSLLKQILVETAPALIATDAARFRAVASLVPPEKILLFDASDPAQTVFPRREPNAPEFQPPTGPGPDDPAVILYTSGSTGAPKGVVLSQYALCNSGKLVSEHFGWQSPDVFMNLGDLHSMSGLRNTCLAPLHSGSSMVIAQPQERGSVTGLFDLVSDLRIQHLGVAPTVIRQMNIVASAARKEKLAPLRSVLCTGAPLAKDQLELFYRNYGKPVFNYYGLTETAGFCAGHNAETFSPSDNSIGKPVGAEFTIVRDPSSDPPDTGELVVKSDNLMAGYFKKEKETAEVLRNGRFYTGDRMRRRPDGCFEWLGRKNNAIKNIHSELIHLEEIDRALEACPLIEEACACAYARFEEDERIVAFIVPKEAPEKSEADMVLEVKSHMDGEVGKNRAPWFYYVEKSLPRNSTGKVQRRELIEKLRGYQQSGHTRYF
jgi:acyl-coenzyme A synthetase/AMP-(fatty) acid ligase